LAGSAFAFLSLYFILSFNDRLASDDIVFVSIKKNMDLFEYLRSFYLTWSGRWTSGIYFYTITSLTDAFESISIYLFLYYFFTLCLLLFSVNRIIGFCILKYFHIALDKITSLIFSVLFIACFYYSTFQNSEVWWWLCSSVDSLQGIVFLLFGIALLIKEEKNIVHYILISLSFIYVGGGFELYPLIIGSFIFLLLVYLLFINQINFSELRKKKIFKGIFVAFISLAISSVISFTAPGNQNRRDAESKNKIESTASTKASTSTGKNIFIQKKYLFAMGLASLWMILGMRLRAETKRAELKPSVLKIILLSSLPFILSIIITWSFQTLILEGFYIPLRGWTFTGFSLALCCCVTCLCIGYSISFNLLRFQNFIKIILPSMVLILLSLNVIKQYKLTSSYAREYDILISKLRDAKKDETIKTIFVKELPPSGMLIPLDITDDYMKDPLKEIFGLTSEITVIE